MYEAAKDTVDRMYEHKKLAMIVALAAGMVAYSHKAHAEPRMEVTAAASVADYDPDHPGDELSIRYTVKNVSSLGDINNMISFKLEPAGINANVFATVTDLDMTDWQTINEEEYTLMDGTGIPLRPGRMGQVCLLSYNTQTTTGYANATAAGDGLFQPPFNQVSVPVPSRQYLAFDVDQNGRIDSVDLVEFASCPGGPETPVPPGSVSTNGYNCVVFDIDNDTNRDLVDFALFQACSGDADYQLGCTGLGDAEPRVTVNQRASIESNTHSWRGTGRPGVPGECKGGILRAAGEWESVQLDLPEPW